MAVFEGAGPSGLARKGRWVCDGQPPIVVTDDGRDLPGIAPGEHGPWVRYRFEWETDDQAKPVLWHVFDALVAFGYRQEAA